MCAYEMTELSIFNPGPLRMGGQGGNGKEASTWPGVEAGWGGGSSKAADVLNEDHH